MANIFKFSISRWSSPSRRPKLSKAYENKFPPFQKPRRHYYPSNLFPLWAECYPKEERGKVARAACKYMRDTGAIYCK